MIRLIKTSNYPHQKSFKYSNKIKRGNFSVVLTWYSLVVVS